MTIPNDFSSTLRPLPSPGTRRIWPKKSKRAGIWLETRPRRGWRFAACY